MYKTITVFHYAFSNRTDWQPGVPNITNAIIGANRGYTIDLFSKHGIGRSNTRQEHESITVAAVAITFPLRSESP